MIPEIFSYSNSLISKIRLDYKRYLYDQINWETRLIEILGCRGVEKTTLMLQKSRELNAEIPNQAVYISLDDKLMYTHSIVGLAEMLIQYDVSWLFLDEVHKYPPKYRNYDWSAEIKNAYDRYPELNIVYSGCIRNLFRILPETEKAVGCYCDFGSICPKSFKIEK